MDSINSKTTFAPNQSKVFSSWDRKISQNWQGIIIPSLSRHNSIKRKDAIWSPSKPDWVKLNFDGASKGNPGPSGIGYVIRDQSEAIIGKMAKPIPPDTHNIAEFTTLLLGLKDCINHGVKNVTVEGDSETAINAIRKKTTPNWRLQALLERILEILNNLEHFKAKHIYREANTEADALSKVAALGTFIHWWSQGS
ncbi:uncharacterized protein LOC131876630 [Cryptomeria japonica]|uniref:uncharacterized protein LOC131876630 n=1 Tax=Cryptomeria japonica TaxID=3369 RepID=UPI0027DA0753|nr:uncharacterized protein LOC131876630 [Cryptomeria japonica]